MSMVNEYSWLKVVAQAGDINLLYTLIKEYPNVLQDIDSKQFVETPLHFAACEGHLEFATEVMRLKPSFAWKLNPQGFSPIHLAMQNDKKSMVFRFVQVDSNLVRVKGRGGLTPLHLASQIGDVDLLADLLYACPDSIEDVTVRSETALHIAIKNQNYESLQVLIGMLKKNHERGSMGMENMILNWKDVEGNTILHISALNNDSQVIGLLVKTRIYLNEKNSKNETALDMATDDGIRAILSKAGAKRGASVSNAPTFVDELRSEPKFVDKIIVPKLRIANNMSEEQRNAILIISVLVATVTYQAALSPPGGVFQANADDNNNTPSFNFSATAFPLGGVFPANAGDNMNSTTSSNFSAIGFRGNVLPANAGDNKNTTSNFSATGLEGKSVLPGFDFWIFYLMNTLAFLTSIFTAYVLTPGGPWVIILLNFPVNLLAVCYFTAIIEISPTSFFIVHILVIPYCFLLVGVAWSYTTVFKSRIRARNMDINRSNSARVNKW